MAEGNPRWAPPVALTEERLKCRFCDWTCPALYANASDKHQTPRDGHTRLAEHVTKAHYQEWRQAGGRRVTRATRGTD